MTTAHEIAKRLVAGYNALGGTETAIDPDKAHVKPGDHEGPCTFSITGEEVLRLVTVQDGGRSHAE